jgi:hypothetical protein
VEREARIPEMEGGRRGTNNGGTLAVGKEEGDDGRRCGTAS